MIGVKLIKRGDSMNFQFIIHIVAVLLLCIIVYGLFTCITRFPKAVDLAISNFATLGFLALVMNNSKLFNSTQVIITLVICYVSIIIHVFLWFRLFCPKLYDKIINMIGWKDH